MLRRRLVAFYPSGLISRRRRSAIFRRFGTPATENMYQALKTLFMNAMRVVSELRETIYSKRNIDLNSLL